MSNFGSNQGSRQEQQATSGGGGGSSGGSYSSMFYSSSASYSVSTSSSTDPQGRTHAQRYSETMTSNDRDGTNIRRVAEETGRPTLSEETYIPPRGGRGIEDGRDGRDGDRQGAAGGRIEDVTDEDDQAARDREYEERMEDEYAKREGGA